MTLFLFNILVNTKYAEFGQHEKNIFLQKENIYQSATSLTIQFLRNADRVLKHADCQSQQKKQNPIKDLVFVQRTK